MNRRISGLTLVEILTSMAILVISFAILFPIFSRAKRASFGTDTIARLHQVGLAGELYAETEGGYPDSTLPLVNERYINPIQCASLEDQFVEGLVNHTLEDEAGVFSRARSLRTIYRNSFFGPRELFIDRQYIDRWVRSEDEGGWLVDASKSTRTLTPMPENWTGTYRRLRFDGSVGTYKYRSVDCNDGHKITPCRMSITMLVNPNSEMLDWIRKL